MSKIRRTLCWVVVIGLLFALLKGDFIFDVASYVIDTVMLRMFEAQYETDLIEINTDSSNGELGLPTVHRLFSDIEKMNVLDLYALTTEIEDNYAIDLNHNEHYIKQIEYNNETYNIFAYVFLNPEASMQYYENYTSYPAFRRECWYEWRLDPSPSFIAYNSNLALRIEGRSIEMIAILLESFKNTFDFEFDPARKIMEDAISSGKLIDAVNEYAKNVSDELF